MNSQTFTIADLEKMVAEHEASAIRVKTIINELCIKGGLPPRYAPTELQQATSGSFSIRSDQFHGRPLATCVREYLEMRRRADLGPASSNEIFDALTQGGYETGAKNEQIARVSMYNSVNKNPAFYKLPNKKWGLREWYPNAKHQADIDDSSETKESAKAQRSNEEKPVIPKSPEKNASQESVISQIQRVLESDRDKQWDADAIMAKVSNVKKNSVSALLFKLQRLGKAEKSGRGLWKAKVSAVTTTAS
jgi:DNA-directed RNA polymerase delta subunit